MARTQAARTPFITTRTSPRNSRSDPASGRRLYRWRGVDYPSVTSIRRMAGLPHGLHQWALNKVVERAVGSADEIAAKLSASNYDPAVVSVIRHELRDAAVAERDAAARIGTAVHDAAASRRLPSEVAEELRPRLAHYINWLAVSGVEVLATEFQVWNPRVGYAGTGDLLVRLRNGLVCLVDIKTGKGVWSEHVLQVVAYARSQFSGNDDVVDPIVTSHLAECARVAVLHLTDKGWEFLVLPFDEEAWEAFRGLLTFASWIWRHNTLESVVQARRTGADPGYVR